LEFKDLTGRVHIFALDFKNFSMRPMSKSGPQKTLGNLLAKIYGPSKILEDYPLPGSNLSWDYWIPHSNIAFEFDGPQHQEFNKFFHKTPEGFVKQVQRDNRKQRLADINGVRLLTITEKPTQELLLRLIKELD